jgi:hypothetical protein
MPKRINCVHTKKSYRCRPTLEEVWKKEFNGKIRHSPNRIHFRLFKKEATLIYNDENMVFFLQLPNKTKKISLIGKNGYGFLKEIHEKLNR